MPARKTTLRWKALGGGLDWRTQASGIGITGCKVFFRDGPRGRFFDEEEEDVYTTNLAGPYVHTSRKYYTYIYI